MGNTALDPNLITAGLKLSCAKRDHQP